MRKRLTTATEFAQSTGTSLPVLACDLSSTLLSQLTLDAFWLNDDDAWRAVQANYFGEERRYLDIVRENAREGVRNRGWGGPVGNEGRGGKGWIWFFSVREGRVSFASGLWSIPCRLGLHNRTPYWTEADDQGFLLQPHK